MSKNRSLIYLAGHNNLFDKIIENKRYEIVNIIKNIISDYKINDVLDIGTTKDSDNKSSNLIIKNLNNINVYKSISDQKINEGFFSKTLQKSITENFLTEEINEFRSDLVLSSAVIEHVGNENNQEQMIKNILKLTNKLFIITTPNRGYPFDFHTKMPFIHWLPKKLHRKILNLIGMTFFSKEENLNLLNKKNIEKILTKLNVNFEILNLKLVGITSNFIVIGRIKS